MFWNVNTDHRFLVHELSRGEEDFHLALLLKDVVDGRNVDDLGKVAWLYYLVNPVSHSMWWHVGRHKFSCVGKFCHLGDRCYCA